MIREFHEEIAGPDKAVKEILEAPGRAETRATKLLKAKFLILSQCNLPVFTHPRYADGPPE